MNGGCLIDKYAGRVALVWLWCAVVVALHDGSVPKALVSWQGRP